MKLAGWGNYPVVEGSLLGCSDRRAAALVNHNATTLIVRGNGRSYGDPAINPDATLSALRLDRLIAFDPATGRLTCEAGLLLADLLTMFVPRGWFPPMTPGTKFVTIGGMVAADVHGKNHHQVGSFGRHVEQLEILTANGAVMVCSRTHNHDLFRATIGGMGLTGVILSATFRLIPIETAWIRQETLVANNLHEVMDFFEQAGEWVYSVAWIDCLARGTHLGRSLLYCGEHALIDDLDIAKAQTPLAIPAKRTRTVPFFLPSVALNRFVVRRFNDIYYRRGAARPSSSIVDYDTFFYPLDAVLEWNRIYGRRGFAQYQCALPREASRSGLMHIVGRIAEAGTGSFLSTLKLFGPTDDPHSGLLSFPIEGYTLALDFPVSRSTLALMKELDAIVADHGGRLYLAKDSRMGRDMMVAGYPGLTEFLRIRNESGAATKFHSEQSRRLAL
jgi:decaprenylphospho-beta-D-ribofuranose 2-oxidase